MLMIVVILIILLLCFGVGAFLYRRNDDKKSSAVDVTTKSVRVRDGDEYAAAISALNGSSTDGVDDGAYPRKDFGMFHPHAADTSNASMRETSFAAAAAAAAGEADRSAMANSTYGAPAPPANKSNIFATMFPDANQWQAGLAPEDPQDFEEDALPGFLS